ncbi:MAG: YeeE/YedE family protein [Chakrabartia sp.]
MVLDPFLLPLLGGVMIGLAAGGLYLLAGEIAGITGIVRIALNGPGRGWAVAFVLGLFSAGMAARALPGPDLLAGIETSSPALLALAGLLVGIGTDLGNGCTSGHGVCGLSRLSPRSLVAVLVFMATAALTVFLVRHGGAV